MSKDSTRIKSSLYLLPPEIRIQIFSQCLKRRGAHPELLAALRADQVLHHEALAIFYRLNYFNIVEPGHWNTIDHSAYTFPTISNGAAAKIQNLCLA
jgi:hypothetical protein